MWTNSYTFYFILQRFHSSPNQVCEAVAYLTRLDLNGTADIDFLN